MGLKDAAKSLMEKANVPVTPGYLGQDQSGNDCSKRLKPPATRSSSRPWPAAGGKGMRKVERAEDFAAALASCQREAAAAFGDDGC